MAHVRLCVCMDLYERKKLVVTSYLMSFSFVKTPTTTSIQLNTTTIDVGFDTIMTVHHHPTPPPPTQELYVS